MNTHTFFSKLLCRVRSFEHCKRFVHKINPIVQKDYPQVTVENQYDVLADVISPLWNLDYTEQLVRKSEFTRELVEVLKLKDTSRSRTKIHQIIPSPETERYRNKDEFSIRTGADGNDKTVGFFVGRPADGKTVCIPPTKLITLKETHILLAEIFQKLIRDSPLRACHDLHDGGYWRHLIVRSNRIGDIMAIIIVHPSGADDGAKEEAKQLIKERFLASYPNIKSLYYQECSHVKCPSEKAPFELLHGDEHIYETINDITIRLSPDSFMQINIDAAEVMYSTLLKSIAPSQKTTILELCSGIGVFSLLASQYARGCIGIECISSAVEDAKFNADYNGITNCSFVHGRIEQKLHHLMSKLDYATEMVPVINPGRGGVSKTVIRILRQTSIIRKLIFVTCKGEGHNTIKNVQDLCSPSFNKSTAFRLSGVQPIDLFPQTDHCEIILSFHR